MMGSRKDLLTVLLAYIVLFTISFFVSILWGFGQAESAHSPGSVWLYVRRIMMVTLAAGLPLLSGYKGIKAFGWKISGKWIVISVVLGGLIGFGNKGGFDPRKVSALLLACFHAFATEIFFRACLITALSETFKKFWPPVLISSVLYGTFYLTVWTMWQQPGGLKMIFFCLFTMLGIIFGYCYKKSGSLLVPWLMHFLGVLQYRALF